jgi:hypothetical protein|tara:strand:+ start:93 stop:254 length:162 start_codon:yes stop_codon:yes gene_type:complete
VSNEVVATIGLLGGLIMNLLYFLNRNARVALAIALGVAALGAAGAIGWITAPV